MASAKKCDRCGNYYDKMPNKVYNAPLNSFRNCECFNQIGFIPCGTSRTVLLDLCEDCMNDFADFLGVKKVEEDDER